MPAPSGPGHPCFRLYPSASLHPRVQPRLGTFPHSSPTNAFGFGLLWPDCTLSWSRSLSGLNAYANQPAGDPVDSDRLYPLGRPKSPEATDGLIPAPLPWDTETLTVFTGLACSPVFLFIGGNPWLGVGCRPRTTHRPISNCARAQVQGSFAQPYCHGSNEPTREYHSILLIQDSLDTWGLRFSPLHYISSLTCPRGLTAPLLPVPAMPSGCLHPRLAGIHVGPKKASRGWHPHLFLLLQTFPPHDVAGP